MVKIEDLQRINTLRDMPEHLLAVIAREAQLSIFSADKELYRADEDIHTFYMLLMGQVALKIKLSDDVAMIIDTVQSGATFGLSALVADTRASSTAVCQEPCEVITLHGERMLELFQENNELGYHFMMRLARHYKQIMEERTHMIMKTLDKYPEYKHKVEDLENLTPIF